MTLMRIGKGTTDVTDKMDDTDEEKRKGTTNKTDNTDEEIKSSSKEKSRIRETGTHSFSFRIRVGGKKLVSQHLCRRFGV